MSPTADTVAPVPRLADRPERLGLAALCALFAVRGLFFWDFVPFWDGREYADCLLDAVAARSLGGLNCFAHPTLGYMLPQALGQLVAHESALAILVVNLLLGVLALAGFHRFLVQAFPGPERGRDRLLLTLALSLFPSVLACALNPYGDYGIFTFFLIALPALHRGERFSPVLPGIAMALSKETGIAMFGSAALAAWLTVVLPAAPRGERLKRTLSLWPWTLPLVALGGFYAWNHFAADGRMWHGSPPTRRADGMFTGGLSDPVFVNYLLGIFVLSFAWLPTLAILAYWVRRIVDAVARRTRPDVLPASTERFLGVLTVASIFLLTRYRTFFNVRYFLPLVPVLLAAAYGDLENLIPKALPRRLLVGATAALFLLANFRTADPLSTAAFGTYRFGAHDLLAMNSLTDECCGFARDQNVHDLQYAQFHYLLDDALATTPAPEVPLAMHPDGDWFFVGRLDRASHRRTLRRGEGTYAPEVYSSVKLEELHRAGRPLPERLTYVALPNYDNEHELKRLSALYDASHPRRVERHGYSLDVLELRRAKAPPQQASEGNAP